MKIISIPVVTRLQDNGDGGYTMRAYNNNEEMLADHPELTDWDYAYKGGTGKRIPKKDLSDADRRRISDEIISERDPYQNGYLSKEKIKLCIADDGTITLAEPLRFHAGQ